MTTLRKSLVITFLASNGAAAVGLIVTTILARILTPAEIGVFSITTGLIALAHVFRDFGVSTFILRVEQLTPDKLRAATGVLIVSSWSIGICAFLASDWAAQYFHQPGIAPVMRVLAAGFLFIPLGATTHALLTREYRAREQALASLIALTIYNTSVLVMAYAGMGYMALAWANLINIIVSGLALAYFRPPGLPWLPSLRGWREVTKFGGGAIIGNCVGSVNNALPDLMLGKLSGPHDVGLLSRASATANIFMQLAGPAVNYAAIPFMAKKHHSGASLESGLTKAVAYLTVCSWPPLLVTAIFARDIVIVLYGWQWLDCIPAVQLFCLLTAINLVFNFLVPGLFAIGRPYLAIAPNLFLLLARAIALVLVYDGTLRSFGWGLVWASLLTIPVNLYIQATQLQLNARLLGRALVPSAVVALACGTVAWALFAALPAHWYPIVRLSILAGFLVPVWLVSLLGIKHPLAEELRKVSLTNKSLERILAFARLVPGTRK